MTNLQTFEEQINGDIQRYRTAVNFATGTDEEKAEKKAEEFAKLESKVTSLRNEYEQYRQSEIERTEKEKKTFVGLNVSYNDSYNAKYKADKFIVDLVEADDAQTQNSVLVALEDALKEFEPGAKVAFYEYIPEIHSMLVDKAASKSAMQAVITEVKNFENPLEVANEKAMNLPTVIGEEFDTIKAEYEA